MDRIAAGSRGSDPATGGAVGAGPAVGSAARELLDDRGVGRFLGLDHLIRERRLYPGDYLLMAGLDGGHCMTHALIQITGPTRPPQPRPPGPLTKPLPRRARAAADRTTGRSPAWRRGASVRRPTPPPAWTSWGEATGTSCGSGGSGPRSSGVPAARRWTGATGIARQRPSPSRQKPAAIRNRHVRHVSPRNDGSMKVSPGCAGKVAKR